LVEEPYKQQNSEGQLQVVHWPILLGSLAFAFLAWSLPIAGKDMGASALEIGGLFAVFALVMALLRPVVGWGLDRFGRRPFFIGALACYAVAMTVFALRETVTGLYVGQFIRGLGSAMMWISAYTLATELAPEAGRGGAVGYVDQSTAQGQLYGALIGFVVFSQFPANLGWQVVFAGYAVMALVAVGLAWRKVPETRPVAATALPSNGALPPNGSLPPALSRLMLVVFITSIATSLLSPIFLIFLQDRFTREIGTLILAIVPAALVSSYLPSRLGRLSDRYGRTQFMALGLLGSAVVAFFLPFAPSLIFLAVVWTLEAVGWAIAGPAQEAMVADMTGRSIRGRGYGLYTFAASIGAAIGPLAGGYLYDRTGHAAPFFLSAVLLLGNAALVLRLFRSGPAVVSPG
jgi:MFS transporter, DHA1 family, multidrug resistance protein